MQLPMPQAVKTFMIRDISLASDPRGRLYLTAIQQGSVDPGLGLQPVLPGIEQHFVRVYRVPEVGEVQNCEMIIEMIDLALSHREAIRKSGAVSIERLMRDSSISNVIRWGTDVHKPAPQRKGVCQCPSLSRRLS